MAWPALSVDKPVAIGEWSGSGSSPSRSQACSSARLQAAGIADELEDGARHRDQANDVDAERRQLLIADRLERLSHNPIAQLGRDSVKNLEDGGRLVVMQPSETSPRHEALTRAVVLDELSRSPGFVGGRRAVDRPPTAAARRVEAPYGRTQRLAAAWIGRAKQATLLVLPATAARTRCVAGDRSHHATLQRW
jgi:hypothetical protein